MIHFMMYVFTTIKKFQEKIRKNIKKSNFFFLLNGEGEKKWEEMFSFCVDMCVFISSAFHTCQFHREREQSFNLEREDLSFLK